MSSMDIPTPDKIKSARQQLGDKVRYTPVWQWKGDEASRHFGESTEIFLKLELFQYGGSFKPRGALLNMMDLDKEELKRGVTAVSAGNHAIAVAYAAKTLDTTAKVVMPKSANPSRVERCKSYGTEVVLVDDVHRAFEKVRQIEEEEGRSFIHPFEGPLTALGTATVGLELCDQVEDLDAVIVPIGGGGLIAGIAVAVKQIQPDCKVYGVEPEGADSMSKSFVAGKPEEIDKVDTMADSLGAPHAAPYSFGLAKQFVDEIVKVSDSQLAATMELMFLEMKLALEPAGASATAALRYPLNDKLKNQRVGIIVCGSNIDLQTFYNNIMDHK